MLDLEDLREIENLCTQEEPPVCIASCPLHVDVKNIMINIENNKVNEAYKLFSKTICFPKIIAYTCDAPCEKNCKRNDLGGSVKINDIEKFLINNSDLPKSKTLFFPKNNNRILIVGGGLRSMTAAFDLARKGFKITIFEKNARLGGKLWESSIPENLLQDEINELLSLPIEVKYNNEVKIDSLEDAETFLSEQNGNALYISCKTELFFKSDKDTLALENPLIFTGSITYKNSSVFKLYDGKSVAVSIDRTLKKVSVMAGRESEGPFETKLFTNTKNILPLPSAKRVDNLEDAVYEAKRCIKCECLECVKGCAFMQHYNSYPKRFIRETYNNLSIAMGRHHANELINTCQMCGQCESICPNGLNMSDVFLTARKIMTDTKKMPPSAHEFALLDMEFSNGDSFFLAEHQPDFDKSEYLFFPSCQLSASEPKLVEKIYKDLCSKLTGGVGLMLGCCGVMAYWAGEEKIFSETIKQLKDNWKKLGKPKIITACPTCQKTLKDFLETEVTGIWDIILEKDFKPANDLKTIAIHDACGSRYDKDTQNNIRTIAEKLGYKVDELTYTKEISPCCGYGGLTSFVNLSLGNEISAKRSSQTDEDILTYCINCRDRFIKNGKKSFHILELVYGSENNKSITWSEKQFNRTKLKDNLLENLWRKPVMKHENLRLNINTELKNKLEERMILESHIEEVILNAKKTNDFFIDPKTKHFISSYRPKNVTFWVEFSENDDEFIIYNAYSHRMTF